MDVELERFSCREFLGLSLSLSLFCFDHVSFSSSKALPVTSEEQMAAFLANLNEMGFCDRQLNLRLLRRHNCDMGHVVTELLQLSHNDWYGSQY